MAYRINRNTEIVIGHEGEKGFREVRFDVSELPEGIIYLEHLRYGDSYAYPIHLERVGDEAVWLPDSTATAKRGTGRGQLVCYVGDEIVAKTDVFKLINRYSLATTDEVPDGYDSWIQRLENLGADIEGKTVDGLNAINEAKDSAFDRISTVSADGIEAINEAKAQGVSAVNSAKTDSLEAIEQKKEAVHNELDGYVEAHHDELKGEKGEKGDDYIVTDDDLKEIGDRVEAEYEPNLNALKSEVSAKAEATDLALANRKIKALTDVLNGKELAFETTDYESAKVEVPSGAVADSILKIGGKSVVSTNLLDITNPVIGADIEYDSDSKTGFVSVTGLGAYAGVNKVLDLNKLKGKSIYLVVDSCNLDSSTQALRIRIDRGSSKSYYTVTPSRLMSNEMVIDDTVTAITFEARANNTASAFSQKATVSAKGLRLVTASNVNAPYEPYFEGIKSSQTDAVGVRGANLIGQEPLKRYALPRTVKAGEKLTYRCDAFASGSGSIYLFNDVGSSTHNDYWSLNNNGRERTITVAKDFNAISFGVAGGGVANNLVVNIGDSIKGTSYSYKEIPTNLPILRSAGSVHDERVYGDVKKQYTRIGAVDLSALTWVNPTSSRYRFPNDRNVLGIKIPQNASTIANAMAEKYKVRTQSGAFNIGEFAVFDSGALYFATENQPTGMLYYELAEPIITDIDPLPQLEAINVEAGGEVSFIDHSGMSFSIPSTHEWVVRNSEV